MCYLQANDLKVSDYGIFTGSNNVAVEACGDNKMDFAFLIEYACEAF